MEYTWNSEEEPETPEQIAFYKAEIARMFAEMDAIEKRIDETQARTAIRAAETRTMLDGMKTCEKGDVIRETAAKTETPEQIALYKTQSEKISTQIDLIKVVIDEWQKRQGVFSAQSWIDFGSLKQSINDYIERNEKRKAFGENQKFFVETQNLLLAYGVSIKPELLLEDPEKAEMRREIKELQEQIAAFQKQSENKEME